MEIEPFPFLLPISREQCGINIKKHELGHPDGVNPPAQLAHDPIKLPEGIVIHAVKETGQRGL